MNKIQMRESLVKEILPTTKELARKPSKDLIVTLSKDGEALSRFSDDIWDYSATSNLVKTINFYSKIEKLSPKENYEKEYFDLAVKSLKTFALNWICIVNGCSMSKLNSDLNAICFLISFCLNNHFRFNEIFYHSKAIDYLIQNNTSEKQIGLVLGKIQRFADTASTLNNSEYWSELSPSREFMNKLRKTRKTFPETTTAVQTLIIPSRIYQSLLKSTIEDLELFNKNIEKIEYIFNARTRARDEVYESLSITNEEVLPGKITETEKGVLRHKWLQLLESDIEITIKLKELLDVGIIKEAHWGSLVSTLVYIQMKSAIVIAAFTGMRKNEIRAIPFNGLKYIDNDNGKLPVVWSTTTKLEENGIPRFTKWITGSIVEIAFKAARSIVKGILRWSDNKSKEELDESKLPLFMSIEHGKSGKPHTCFEYATTHLGGHLFKTILLEKNLLVSEQDIEEIDWFLYGDVIPSNIKMGEPWPLGFHQFRRSLAVYAASSGFVSYPTLKSQLKHISMVMTVYYTDSNSRSINILGDEAEVKAMRKEWEDANSRKESDDLYKLLESDVNLAGGAGKSLQAKKRNKQLPKFLKSRKDTKKAVKNGRIRYRSTLVGGCMSIIPCDKGAGILASACISCENAVFLLESRSSLLQTKEFYESQLQLDIPKRIRIEYETSVKKIDSVLSVLIANN